MNPYQNELPTNFHPNFRSVPRTGVIYVMEKATALGFNYASKEWSNLGQGAPETGSIEDSPDRLTSIPIDAINSEYSPVGGIAELKQAVADLYNSRYRGGKSSLYTQDNVAISSGGRAGLTRIAAALGSVNLGHFLPDYTAYEELLELFKQFVPIPIVLNESTSFKPTAAQLREEVIGKGLGAILISNPSNPTGQLISDEEKLEWIHTGQETNCILIFDEFYSHYIYDQSNLKTSSAASAIDDVNEDQVLIIDGLTKNWRYPGLRLSWSLGPKNVIRSLASAGSFLDGGAPHPIQKVAIPFLTRDNADKEAASIQKLFAQKRDWMVEKLQDMGFILDQKPKGSFYCFPSLKGLPEPLQNSMTFFEKALEKKVITVPGTFFDVNPGKRRSHIPSRLRHYARLSFGPPMEELELGVSKLKQLIEDYK